MIIDAILTVTRVCSSQFVAFSARRPQFLPKAVHVHRMGMEQITVTVLQIPLVLSPILYVNFAAVLVGEELGQLEAVLAQRHCGIGTEILRYWHRYTAVLAQ